MAHETPTWLKPAGFVALGVAGLIVVAGLIGRGVAGQHLKAEAQAEASPTVDVVRPTSATRGEGLTLPGTVQAEDNAVIHARVSGYLKHWYVDIGANVKAGQTLADIDTPELDLQMEQAKANLATAMANQKLAKSTAERWAGLLTRDAVSKQEADEKAGDLEAKTALVQASKADLDRLHALQSFKRIVAPFAGVVTARNTDVGALIAAGNPADPGLFTVADVHRMRVYVRVPQSYSASIKPGVTAALTLPEYPGRSFQAKLATTSGAVAAQTGAVLVELQLDNPDNALKPGAYTQVRFDLPAGPNVVQVPATALLFRKEGLMVAVVGADNRARMKFIKVRRDLGTAVEVESGLSPADRVIDNPPDSLADNQAVRVAAVKQAG